MATFYDNDTDHIVICGNLRAYERVYCLQFSEFADADWSRLDQIYRALPGWVGPGADGCPWWFGADETGQFLWASVEPSGLMVHGRLPQESWRTWDEAFRQRVSDFPTFEV